jgi:hypothetical protein
MSLRRLEEISETLKTFRARSAHSFGVFDRTCLKGAFGEHIAMVSITARQQWNDAHLITDWQEERGAEGNRPKGIEVPFKEEKS